MVDNFINFESFAFNKVHKELGKTKVSSHTIKEAQGRLPVKLHVMPEGWEGRTVNESY